MKRYCLQLDKNFGKKIKFFFGFAFCTGGHTPCTLPLTVRGLWNHGQASPLKTLCICNTGISHSCNYILGWKTTNLPVITVLLSVTAIQPGSVWESTWGIVAPLPVVYSTCVSFHSSLLPIGGLKNKWACAEAFVMMKRGISGCW